MLVTIEGIDGAGKYTQSIRLQERARTAGYRVLSLSFPRYQETSFASAIGTYLNGGFGTLNAVSPYLGSLLYAGDRFESLGEIRRLLGTSDLLVCDRYVPSNMAYQAAKLPESERPAFLKWITHIEYEVFQLPRPDLVLYMDIGIDLAAQLVASKKTRSYTDQSADLHEADREYMRTCRDLYLQFAASADVRHEPWRVISAVDAAGRLRQVDEIAEDLWNALKVHLPPLGAPEHEIRKTAVITSP